MIVLLRTILKLIIKYYLKFKIMEIVKRDFNMSFDLLISNGKLGFYKSCEVIEIFLINKLDNSILNIYTLIYFNDSIYNKKSSKYLTQEPIKINKNYSLGIQKYYLTIEEAKKRFESLKKNIWINSEDEEFKQKPLKLIPKQFISLQKQNRLKEILIKKDEIQSSYILEFFNCKKEFSFNNNYKEFNKINKYIEENLDFKFEIIPERIGNFIFQFPVTILNVKQYVTTFDRTIISINLNKKLSETPNGIVSVTSKQDGIIIGNSTKKLKEYNEEEFIFTNFSYDGIETTIYDLDNHLILYHDVGKYMYDFYINAKVVSPDYVREFYENDVPKTIHLNKISPIIKHRPANYNDDINRSVKYIRKIELSNKLSFKQYNKDPYAITDLQRLISENGENGVYLWDPYLTANEIFKTLYYSKTLNVPLKAITSKKAGKINEIKKEFKIEKQPNLNLNLEVRMQHGIHGYPFHDRFLIFPSKNIYEEPKVYSLGTSVNSFGNKHHILQLISYPDLIIDAFNEL